tara:strand:+ start:17 stop:598 length:582 start_codon:yes stop_codon:yes gene_type:complete
MEARHLERYSAIRRLVSSLEDEPVVANLGPTSIELWNADHREQNFYTNGAMGLCSSIALGVALSVDSKVISLDGDGSLLMNLGSLSTIGRARPKNLIIVVWDNEQWGQTGHQPSHTAKGTDLESVARGCGIVKTATVDDLEELSEVFIRALHEDGPWLIVAKIEETGYLPLKVFQPDLTLYRFRRSVGSVDDE